MLEAGLKLSKSDSAAALFIALPAASQAGPEQEGALGQRLRGTGHPEPCPPAPDSCHIIPAPIAERHVPAPLEAFVMGLGVCFRCQ